MVVQAPQTGKVRDETLTAIARYIYGFYYIFLNNHLSVFHVPDKQILDVLLAVVIG